jgi:hypothetical protein
VNRYGVTAETGLATVGLTVQGVRDAAAPFLTDGEAYLVGSLAARLGNHASDVDLHLLQLETEATTGPRLSHAGSVLVDVECYPTHLPRDLTAAAAALPCATIGAGSVSLAPALDRRTSWRLSRWIDAVPLRDGAAPIIASADASAVISLLSRGALEHTVRAAAVAELAEAGDLPASARAYLWRNAGRRLVDLACRLVGDVSTGEKWLSKRAKRSGATTLLNEPSKAGFQEAAQRLDLPSESPWAFCHVRPAAGSRTISLCGETLVVTRQGRCVKSPCESTGSMRDAISEFGVSRVFEAIHRAELDVFVDDDTMNGALRS